MKQCCLLRVGKSMMICHWHRSTECHETLSSLSKTRKSANDFNFSTQNAAFSYWWRCFSNKTKVDAAEKFFSLLRRVVTNISSSLYNRTDFIDMKNFTPELLFACTLIITCGESMFSYGRMIVSCCLKCSRRASFQ